jgi:hypothetical protein
MNLEFNKKLYNFLTVVGFGHFNCNCILVLTTLGLPHVYLEHVDGYCVIKVCLYIQVHLLIWKSIELWHGLFCYAVFFNIFFLSAANTNTSTIT